MTLEELLRSAARDVADTTPDTYVSPSAIRSRALGTRRRQRAGLVAGLVAAGAMVTIGLQLAGGPEESLEPVQPAPSPTPDASTAPGVPVVEVPEIGPEDLREYEELRTITNTQPGYEGVTELTFEVPVRDRYSFEWSHFCTGDPDTWYVLIVGDGGASGSGYCDFPAPEPFPTFPTDISPSGHSGSAGATQVVRMMVVDEIPPQQQRCFDRKSPPECLDGFAPLEPLARTDVTFGISVYEYWAPSVAEVLGQELAARASIGGTDYLLSQVLTPGAGQHSFSTTLPSADGDRIVAVLERSTEALYDCERAAGSSLKKYRECEALLELRIGDRTVPLVREEDGDIRTMAVVGPHGFFRVPAGDQEVVLRVASGNPDHTDFALVVFDEAP
jgi:hypothetical protein